MGKNSPKDTATRRARTRNNMTDIEHGGASTSDEDAARQVRTSPISSDAKARAENPPRHEYASWGDDQLHHHAENLGIEGHEEMSRDELVEVLRRAPNL